MVSLLDVAISVLIRLKNVSDEPSHRLPQDLKVGTFSLRVIEPFTHWTFFLLAWYPWTLLIYGYSHKRSIARTYSCEQHVY